MGKLCANRTLLGNISLVVFLAFLVMLTVGAIPAAQAAPAPVQDNNMVIHVTPDQPAKVRDRAGNWIADGGTAVLETSRNLRQVQFTIQVLTSDFDHVLLKLDGQSVVARGSGQVVYRVYDSVYSAYQLTYTWIYQGQGGFNLNDNYTLEVFSGGSRLASISLDLEAPPPEDTGGGPPVSPPVLIIPPKKAVWSPLAGDDTVTGTLMVDEDGNAMLDVEETLVEALLADLAEQEKVTGRKIKSVEFVVPAEAIESGRGTVAIPVGALAAVLASGRTAVMNIGGTLLEIGPGAIDLSLFAGQDVTLHVNIAKGAAESAAAMYRIAGEVYSISIDAYADGERKGAVKNFDRPVTLTLPYDPANLTGGEENALGMYRFNESTGKWDIIPGARVDKRNKTVSASRNTLSMYTVMVYTGQFRDMAGHWAEADVYLMAARGIAGGVSETSFAPDQNVTRAQFAAQLVRSLGISERPAAGNKFKDVSAGAWYAGAVETAAAVGLVTGYPDGSFKPEASITRQELAVMVTRALAYKGEDTTLDKAAANVVLARFSDASKISPWAREAAAVAVEAGIVGGRSGEVFAPRENATRAEAVVMLKRMLVHTDSL